VRCEVREKKDECRAYPCAWRGVKGEIMMPLQPIVALIAGILILIFPRILNYVVAIYLIVVGIMGLARV